MPDADAAAPTGVKLPGSRLGQFLRPSEKSYVFSACFASRR
jgi:hypothetical protein